MKVRTSIHLPHLSAVEWGKWRRFKGSLGEKNCLSEQVFTLNIRSVCYAKTLVELVLKSCR
ncbi:hypothetical protein AZ468_08390 [Vibrio europaeus]|uniref:Uncharacterized protein n=1 Tax=Vibrio europaeus TaxID=300876 RepID=A0A178JI55_9VIBR|nr:hypothetical protein AZ468_08390 [Vibrio europaeus]